MKGISINFLLNKRSKVIYTKEERGISFWFDILTKKQKQQKQQKHNLTFKKIVIVFV